MSENQVNSPAPDRLERISTAALAALLSNPNESIVRYLRVNDMAKIAFNAAKELVKLLDEEKLNP